MSGDSESRIDRSITDVDGPEAMPRKNGELVFDAPWEARAFAIAIALVDDRRYQWVDFRAGLIDEIAAWEQANGVAGEGWSYYERWLASLERIVIERGLVTDSELNEKASELETAALHEHEHHDGHHHD